MHRSTNPVKLLLAAAVLSGGLALPVLADPVYVDAASGNNLNPGSMASPVKTINAGIALAAQTGCPVYVAGGSYVEQVVLVSGIRVHGGFNANTGWLRDGSISNISGPTVIISGNGVNDVIVDGFRMVSGSATWVGDSAYSIYLNSCTNILINNCNVIAGNGREGGNGSIGLTGTNGGSGFIGQPGCEDGGAFCGGSCSTPQGGTGGTSPNGNVGGTGGRPVNSASSGLNGSSGLGFGAGNGGQGTPPNNGPNCPNSAYWGQPGLNGADGQDGLGGDSWGLAGVLYLPASGDSGTNGVLGAGGGGGGGGGGENSSCQSYGSGGGGGGGGANGGGLATGGGGGGGSFAVYAVNSADISIIGSILQAGDGGNGGLGGSGGLGGIGGLGGETFGGCGSNYGGSVQDGASMGAKGGDGGDGGMGGDGGGGGGGPSVALYSNSGVVGVDSTSYFISSAGQGGSAFFPGADGVAVQIAATTGPVTITQDCNNNSIHDAIDIADGILIDDDCDGVPDSCDPGCTVNADVNGDGVLDNGDIIDFIEAFLAGCK